MRAICNTTCFWGTGIGRGQAVNVNSMDDIPQSVRPFFTPENEIKEVDTALSIDELRGKAEVDEKLPNIEGAEGNQGEDVERIRKELEALGKPFDRRWGKDKLTQELNKVRRGL